MAINTRRSLDRKFQIANCAREATSIKQLNRRMIMTKPVQPIPEGFHTLTPYLIIKGAAQAIDFYKQAFGAEELFRMPGPDGKTIGHAEIKLGDSIVMLSDECPDFGFRSPQSLNGTPVSFMFYVKDVDATFKRAVDAGATVIRPLENQFYGDRTGTVADPFGHVWSIGTHVEDVAPEELQKRAAAEHAKMAAKTNQ
jgi:PhnB protein